ncbi:hypothetical protein CR513_48486, partial [Mucuna pruriens]
MHLIISKNGEKSIAISAIGRLKSTVPVWEGNSEHLFKNKHLIISETLMHSPALDALYIVRESLKSELRGDNVKLLPCSSLGLEDTICYSRMCCFGTQGKMSDHIQECETTVNITDEVQKVDPKRSQNCESLSNLAIHFHSGKSEVGASEAKVKGILGSDSSVYIERLQKSCNSDTPPLKSKKSARTELSSGDCLMEGKQNSKDGYGGVASCSIFNSKVGQLSQTHDPFSPKSLYMKFPKNFNLPSKEQLMKKFSVFGSVDSSRTRVSFCTGSAQVTFLKQAEAVAAYQYAKTKVLFGEANVRFWLDPFEHKRRGFKSSPQVPSSASKQIGPPLKSCLKNSNSLRQENRKKRCRLSVMDQSSNLVGEVAIRGRSEARITSK